MQARQREHRGGQVGRDDPVPVVQRLGDRVAAGADADVVVQDVEAAVALGGEGGHRLGGVGVGDVRRERRGLAALGADRRLQRLRPLEVAVDQHDAGAFPGEEGGDRAAVADPLGLRRRPRDDGDLARQPAHARPPDRPAPVQSPNASLISPASASGRGDRRIQLEIVAHAAVHLVVLPACEAQRAVAARLLAPLDHLQRREEADGVEGVGGQAPAVVGEVRRVPDHLVDHQIGAGVGHRTPRPRACCASRSPGSGRWRWRSPACRPRCGSRTCSPPPRRTSRAASSPGRRPSAHAASGDGRCAAAPWRRSPCRRWRRRSAG